MQIVTDPHALQSLCLDWRFSGLHTALVPTMGYLHAGHESLISKAREMGDKVVVTLFVNPTQFGPNEDLAAYPRAFERDAAKADELGADVLFAPEPSAMYEPDASTWVTVDGLDNVLCGADRPGHFRGVCTVVTKLLMLAMPEFALFGQKDWQQLAVLRRMVRDLNIPTALVGCPTVREPDGLALSSRNAYLTPDERAAAPHLFAGLKLAKHLAGEGETDPERLRVAVLEYWKEHLPTGRPDYLAFVHPETLQDVTAIKEATLAVTAVRLGKARLIDNLLLRS